MTASKAFWKIVAKNIGIVIMYSVILISFGTIAGSSNNSTLQFEAEKPKIAVFNHDKETGITKGLVEYLQENAEVPEDYSEDKVTDDLFYRDIAMAIDIPENYSADFAAGKNPELHTRSSSDYSAELAKVMISRYLTTAQSYAKLDLSDDELNEKVSKALESKVEVEVKSKVDVSQYSKATSYFNFANYAMLACIITIICLIISSFNRREIRRRNLVSSIPVTKMNRVLLRNSCLYSFAIWLLYVVVGYFRADGENLINERGALYLVNSFIFCVCATTIAYLISQIVSSRNAVNAIMNIVALGSSFLCGCFVPAEFMPSSVLMFAHVLPSFYYVDTNNKIARLENFELTTLQPLLINMGIVLVFCIVFVAVANIIAKKKQRE